MKSELRALLSHHLNERELTQADEALTILNSESPSEEAYDGALWSLEELAEKLGEDGMSEAAAALMKAGNL